MKKHLTIFIFLLGVLLFADGAFTYYKGEEFGFLGRGKSANMSPGAEMLAGALVILSFAFAVTAYRKKKE
ncbi:MAG: hypothetical protein NT118_09770 [Lentisphaerae bacterium]|nr:hypothetical protein [Lentisphaerota bacterium]